MKKTLAVAAFTLISTTILASTGYQVGAQALAVDGAANDLLGFSVAASPQRSGVRLAVAGAVGRGAYVATLLPNSTVFALGQRFNSPSFDDNYGLSVAIANPPGGAIIAVGAPGDDEFGMNAGKVYLYRMGGAGIFVSAGTITPPTPAVVGNFGTALAFSPDGNTLLIGEPRAQPQGSEVGAVHSFNVSGGPVTLNQTLVGNLGIGARFGQSVAFDGQRLAVGAPLADDSGSQADTGAVAIYTLSSGSLVADGPTLFASDRAVNDRLGTSVAIDGAVMLTGAANDDKMAGVDAGSAYVFRRGANWTEETKLRSLAPQIQERFGNSVAIKGNQALVGAYCLNVSGCVGGGAVYSYLFDGSAWVSKQPLSAVGSGAFGHAIAIADIDAVIVGAFGTDGNAVDQGAVYALTRTDALFRDGFEDNTP